MTQNFTLIADAGGSKTEWVLINRDDHSTDTLITEGVNATTSSDQHITDTLLQLNGWIDGRTPSHVHFYGAGCVNEEACARISHPMMRLWDNVEIEIASDLLGAARALCGNKPGIIAILGTGSNSARYNGKKITANTPPMGYILGDEGGGASLGRRLISDIYKGLTETSLKRKFEKETGLNYAEIIRRTYREENAPKFLASVVPFIRKHCAESGLLKELVFDEFDNFIERNIYQYLNIKVNQLGFIATINLVGSVAFHFGMEFAEVALQHNMRIGTIAKTPIPGLIEYHTKNL